MTSNNQFKKQIEVSFDQRSTLIDLLNKASAELKQLSPDPVFIAECPHKFNDAGQDDLWYSAQVGASRWELSHFFEEVSVPYSVDHSYINGEFSAEELQAYASELESNKLEKAREILRELQRAGWYELTYSTIENCGRLVGLLYYAGQAWLCESTPNVSDGYIWIWDDEKFVNIGTCDDRLDHTYNLHLSKGINFYTINPRAIGYLSEQAREYFIPSINKTESFDYLSSNLLQAVEAVRRADQGNVYIRSKDIKEDWRYARWRHDYSGAALRWAGASVIVMKDNDVKWLDEKKDAEPLSEKYFAFGAIANELENLDWRGLYEEAFGITLARLEALSLYVTSDTALLCCRNSAFEITSEGLRFVGICPTSVLLYSDDLPAVSEVKV